MKLAGVLYTEETDAGELLKIAEKKFGRGDQGLLVTERKAVRAKWSTKMPHTQFYEIIFEEE